MIIMMFWLTDIKLVWNNKVKKEHVNLHEQYTELSLLKTVLILI